MATQTYQLVLRSGPHPGRVFELAQDVVSIGRDVANTIVINDAEVSRRHARLTAQAGGYILEDLGSTNGTFVNGTRLLGPHLIRAGETITLAENIVLEVQVLHMDPDATVAVASGPVTAPAAEKQAPYPPESYQTSVPTQKPAYAAPMPPPVQPAPAYTAYSGQIPQGPVEVEDELEKPSRKRTLLYAGCGCLVVLLCVLAAGAFVFDYLNLYCTPPFQSLFPCP